MRRFYGIAALVLVMGCTGEKTGMEAGLQTPASGQSKAKAEAGLMLEGACEDDDPETFNPENCYKLGGVRMAAARPNIVGARAAYSRACNTHHALACYELGKMVRDARGGPRDARRAIDVLGIACEGGVSPACVDLGVILYDGSATTKADPGRAVAYFQTACSAEPPSPLACSRLARAYVEGVGVAEKDEEQARVLYEKACALDDPESCVNYGRWLIGSKKKEDVQLGATFLDKACTADARFGCFELGGLHADPKLLVDASPERAANYFQRACNIDPIRGCFEAAELMESGQVPARKEQIQSLYNVACEHGNPDACARRSPD